MREIDAGRAVVRHRDVKVHPIALRARCVHLLEPDGRQLAGRIDDGSFLAILPGTPP
jgi:hypothetical protein